MNRLIAVDAPTGDSAAGIEASLGVVRLNSLPFDHVLIAGYPIHFHLVPVALQSFGRDHKAEFVGKTLL
ncbi:MAG: hypothetical protein WCB12_12915 [Bryobacteraceae bacterium]